MLDYVDGSSLAGPMRELFAVDVTAVEGRCAACGLTGPIAALHVYGHDHGPGLVGRCPGCDEIVLRLVRTPTDAWLDVRGAVSLRFSL
ncbi:hypothetical protein HDA40_006741 [Hamadaea flava]|uniref:DUF6510 family protein n=1 Tax=Hamadaea flava TaxID=1742688 RepID=A0ABV8LUM1_9ACTN|nr:DUF6510 family protein [Hamadaea flava]MCP2328234.1 hypothetical protein [Hamadaea flava]